jgi:iron complex outermembrane receptor protein
MTLLAGGHWQSPNDIDGDQWLDLAGYSRANVRPRVFWTNDRGGSFFATVGFTAENRTGGLEGADADEPGASPIESLRTRRLDAGAVGQFLWGAETLVSLRGAVSEQRHQHTFTDVRERDAHRTIFTEATIRRGFGDHVFVAGAAYEEQSYRAADLAEFDFRYRVPGVFAQADLNLRRWLALSGSVRVDRHSEYGTFASPRLSVLARAGAWVSRMSIGTGFFGPSPLTEETEAAGLTRLSIPEPLVAERGTSASIDVTRGVGPLSVTLTLFASRIRHAISVDRSGGLILRNLADPVTNAGLELLGTVRHEPWSLTASYAYVRTREVTGGLVRDVALTPRHSAGVVGMWEEENAGRVGVEVYFTGAQRLDENPFRTTSEPYVVVGVLAERRFGRIRLFVNGENLTGVRQTSWDPLLRPARAADGRWTVDAWAPLDGRNINGGVRVSF